MRKIQSSGMGLNSIALSAILGNEYEIVFSDVGSESPDTYKYMDYWRGLGNKLTVLIPSVEGYHNIEDYYRYKVKCPPFRAYRSCTDKFKKRTLERYYGKDPENKVLISMGIAYDERHRARTFETRNYIFEYPLVDEKITRKGCIEIIEDAGLKVPPKSGCFFCPFQPKASWQRLARNHPELYWRAVSLEELSDKIDLHPKGLRNLWPPPLTLKEALDPDEDWECSFCFTPAGSDSTVK